MNALKKNKYACLSFLIPFACMTAIMIGYSCRPFGNQSFMVVDAVHQYLPFFSDYQEKLKSLDSFFYSWNGGMGYNFYSLWAYYLSSPLNLIVALVPKMTMITVLNWLIAIKFSLCSFTAFVFFSHREGKQSMRNVVLGLCYAFSTYMTGYYWNVMWLEVMILLPIVLLGMDRLMNQGDGRIYCLALFGSLFCNYYMSFMVCIFLVLWYFTYNFKSVREFFQKGIHFAVDSILAAAMSAIVLLPAYLGLMSTSSAKLEWPTWKLLGEIKNLLGTHLVAGKFYNMAVEDGLGNLYCGMLPLVLLLLYVMDTNLAWKDKLRKIAILVFMALSFQVEILNYIWHGFHNQYGIPNRFAFLYVFLILVMAHDELSSIDKEEIPKWKVAIASGLLLIGIGVLAYLEVCDSYWPYIISAALIIVYSLLLIIDGKYKKPLLYAIVSAEVLINAAWSFSCSGQVDVDYYFGNTAAIQKIKDKEQPKAGERMELYRGKMLDESIWHTMAGVTMFGSTALGETVTAMDQYGFFTGVNEYLYEGGTPVTDMLFGVRSLLYRDDENMTRSGYEYVYQKDGVRLYKNNLPLSLGYWMGSGVQNWQTLTANPFEMQNTFMTAAYGVDTLYQAEEVNAPVGRLCTVTDQGGGTYYIQENEAEVNAEFEKDEPDLQKTATFVFNIEEDKDFYLHFDSGLEDSTEIRVNDKLLHSGRWNSQIVSLGKLSAGDVVSVKLLIKDGTEGDGTVTMRAASLNQESFRTLKKQMKDNRFQVTSCTSGKVSGSIDAKESGTIFFSIPYDEGWSVTIDGAPANTQAMEYGFLSVPVQQGKHTVELSYCPRGFSLGWKISLLGWAGFFLLVFWNRKKKFTKNSMNSNEDSLEAEV